MNFLSKSKRKPLRKTYLSRETETQNDDEDLEIERLEKLLGVSKEKKEKSIEKLNQEYSLFEGMGDDFGSFLFDLDQICDKSNTQSVSTIIRDSELNTKDSEVLEDQKVPIDQSSSRINLYGKTNDHTIKAYLPPALRTKDLSQESSLNKTIQGLINRLCDESKDKIFYSLKDIYTSNSHNITNSILFECLISPLLTSKEKFNPLVSLSAALISSLSVVIDREIGANFLEYIFRLLSQQIPQCEISGSKAVHNLILLLTNLYIFKSLNQTLIFDLCLDLAKKDHAIMIQLNYETKLEILEGILLVSGEELRHDDPSTFLVLETDIKAEFQFIKSSKQSLDDYSKLEFLLESLSAIFKSKKRKSLDDSLVILLRWIANLKKLNGSKSGYSILRVSLKDLMNIETRGRWWKAGAAWVGFQNESEITQQQLNSQNSLTSNIYKNEVSQNIFNIFLSCRDVHDAFERIIGLNLKGKVDREIIRVLFDCCSKEKSFNEFYSQLSYLLCDANRQYKLTFKRAFLDFFQNIENENLTKKLERKIINLARLLSNLIIKFSLSLSLFIVISVDSLSDPILLFLNTFFLELFSTNISISDFKSIFDRIAASKNHSSVREFISFYIQSHLINISNSLTGKIKNCVKERIKLSQNILKDLKILDINN